MPPFNQPAPQLGNQYSDDRLLQLYLRRRLPADVLSQIKPALQTIGDLAGNELYQLQLADRLNEPQLTQWDAWGERIDQIVLTPLWQRAEQIAASYGLIATAYEQTFHEYSRTCQFALAYLFHPSSDVYSCPLAMTDGAARTLLQAGNQALIERAIPHLISRDPDQFWTSGQWMTESTGGSDVGLSETIARQAEDGTWRLYGRKWFSSATTSQMALTLARPEGNPAGGRGLALFYVETRDQRGRLTQIEVNRLKDKLGTRKVPTAELNLLGTPAIPVQGLRDGVRAIVPMLQITRTWNSVSAVGFMRRGMALAQDYAQKRWAFGSLLNQKPLHVDTLAGLQAEYAGAFLLTFYLIELLGLDETGRSTPQQRQLLRLLTSIAKLTTARQAVNHTSEIIESFGGAGYVEDTGLPSLLRDAQVLSIWEGTTNVLALDSLRALSEDPGIWPVLREQVNLWLSNAHDPSLSQAIVVVQTALDRCEQWLAESSNDRSVAEMGARRWALTLGRALELALLIEHAQAALIAPNDRWLAAAARRFSCSAVNLIATIDANDNQILLS
ncbi:MAG TPA: acyl-CoA dehydrogenase [Herpetosiphon sp.]|uniref:Acyl-CoA dehydrogenase domain protein n=1 Tax=Herpetosiphon aurantiacus (strain ATCC 23779 / DSM 785 / 114-95) TaxID=316274 RepID=A9B2X8_HERA2|nr:acyl-CoA dehydrogenase family protein [Herpetosiphon sp.]ABX06041.1 acyl-CoA dehydrogenase domain protein [Herpetosiphon aurantiacus DSM 785]HBW50640.1 acyl-CoA dehydrogenase [Herpetosiphon sp.]